MWRFAVSATMGRRQRLAGSLSCRRHGLFGPDATSPASCSDARGALSPDPYRKISISNTPMCAALIEEKGMTGVLVAQLVGNSLRMNFAPRSARLFIFLFEAGDVVVATV